MAFSSSCVFLHLQGMRSEISVLTEQTEYTSLRPDTFCGKTCTLPLMAGPAGPDLRRSPRTRVTSISYAPRAN